MWILYKDSKNDYILRIASLGNYWKIQTIDRIQTTNIKCLKVFYYLTNVICGLELQNSFQLIECNPGHPLCLRA